MRLSALRPDRITVALAAAGKALRGHAAPQLAAACCVLALTLTAWHDGNGIYRQSHASGPPVAAKDAGSPLHRIAVDVIARAHLFGAPPAGAPAGAPLTAAGLVLTGTIATSEPGKGHAILGTTPTLTHYYAVGETVGEGVVLRAVYADRVIIDNNGELQTLSFPHRMSLQLLQAMNAPQSADEDSAPQPDQDEIRGHLDSETNRLATILKEKPYFSGDQFRGVVIEEGSTNGLLERLGLKPGDLLHHVDGAVLANGSRLDLLRERLASGGMVHVGITRPGTGPMDLTVDSSLVASMVQ